MGDVFQISLPNGNYAYGRVFEDATVGVYNHITTAPNVPPIGLRDYMFLVGMYRHVLTRGECPIIGQDRFDVPEDAWPPPNFIRDQINGGYSLYYKGEITPGTKGQCEGLEEAAVWDLPHIVERIMKQISS